jgi:ABC-2 type transport system ATP-binding protein
MTAITAPLSDPAIETRALGKRYGAAWALNDCTLEVPTGSVTALVGPNGAGKSTLLQLLAGLSTPTTGEAQLLGLSVRDQASLVLPRLGFVAQDHPLERGFTVAEMLKMGRKLNPGWDNELALSRIEQLGIPLERKVTKLSGGQQAQIALAIALGKRPDVLILDEPVAALDPLARRDFLSSLMAAVTERDLTVLLSSHILGDLERVCDYLLVLAGGRIRLAGSIERIIESHRVLTGPHCDATAIGRHYEIVEERHVGRQSTFVVRSPSLLFDAKWQVDTLSLEEIVLAYLERYHQEGTAP